MSTKVMRAFRFSRETISKLEKIASDERCSMTTVIERALSAYVETSNAEDGSVSDSIRVISRSLGRVADEVESLGA